ncbi:uncharacterized protein RHO25_006987 [Cercospora beticola]|nr:hypothetical protein RHO25_006987 [Cercospora beticola]CAK1362763.1 unnamed protein product [Cercospora beticola]
MIDPPFGSSHSSVDNTACSYENQDAHNEQNMASTINKQGLLVDFGSWAMDKAEDVIQDRSEPTRSGEQSLEDTWLPFHGLLPSSTTATSGPHLDPKQTDDTPQTIGPWDDEQAFDFRDLDTQWLGNASLFTQPSMSPTNAWRSNTPSSQASEPMPGSCYSEAPTMNSIAHGMWWCGSTHDFLEISQGPSSRHASQDTPAMLTSQQCRSYLPQDASYPWDYDVGEAWNLSKWDSRGSVRSNLPNVDSLSMCEGARTSASTCINRPPAEVDSTRGTKATNETGQLHSQKSLDMRFERQIHPDGPQLGRKMQRERKWTCDACGKSFFWPKDLARHKATHQQDSKRYKCPFPGCELIKGFARKDHLDRHKRSHHLEFLAQDKSRVES